MIHRCTIPLSKVLVVTNFAIIGNIHADIFSGYKLITHEQKIDPLLEAIGTHCLGSFSNSGRAFASIEIKCQTYLF
jgi:hypothetical protein